MQAYAKSYELGKPIKFLNLGLSQRTKMVLSVGFGLFALSEVKSFLERRGEQ